jgi:hypothetical protein
VAGAKSRAGGYKVTGILALVVLAVGLSFVSHGERDDKGEIGRALFVAGALAIGLVVAAAVVAAMGA